MTKIINIVGTSGAGKSHVVRNFVRKQESKPIYIEGRTAPFGYEIESKRIFIVGAYEAASSGGCDTFGGDSRVERLYKLVQDRWSEDWNVIYEGITMMNHTRGIELWNKTKSLNVIFLQVSLEDCINSVQRRRVEIGKEPEFATQNIKTNFVRAKNYSSKLKALGCPVYKVSREEAGKVLERLLEE